MKKQSSNFDELTLSNDFMFKHVMLRPQICKHFLEETLQKKIIDISYTEMEKTIDAYYDSHGIRLDITVSDIKNTHYNLEMQVKNTYNNKTKELLLPKRTRYYQSMLDIDMLQKGEDYDALSPSFIIFICPFDCFGEDRRIYTFKKRCLENLTLELPDEATVVFLNTIGSNGSVSPDLQSLYDYINNNVVTSNFTKNIADTIVEIKNDKKVRQAYMTYEMRMKDLRNDALAEGRAEGLEAGKAEEKIDIAKNLLQMNLSTQDIAKATKLSIAEIQKLQAEMLQPV